ncbi:MAG: S41 family peptidase [Lewinella sp.]|nr:S41 family peptidase [Lewinella sp.]
MDLSEKFKIILWFVLLSGCIKSAAQSEYLDRSEMLSDLAYLQQELERHHPNLYTYSSPAAVREWFRSQHELPEDRIDLQKAYHIVTSFSAVLKDGHSYIYPDAGHLDRFYQTAPLFPLDVFLMGQKLIVTGNFSNEQNIPEGSELVSINGVSIPDLLSFVLEHMSRDGDNLEYPKYLFYQFFPAYYSFFYGFPEAFEIVYVDQQGESTIANIKGITRDEIRKKRADTQSNKEMGIDLQTDEHNQLAVLTIRSFDNDLLKKEYHIRFKREIRTAFKKINVENIQHLAIDLRGNQGGELSNGVYLLKHFMDQAFTCVDSYFVIRKQPDHKRQPKQLRTKWDVSFQPKKINHFNGKVYILLNGGSFSCSAIVSNAFKNQQRGIIIGQMSGGSAYINSGGPDKVITLPHSGISFTIPKTQYNLRADPSVIGLGVMPDISVQDIPFHCLEVPDPYLVQLMQLISK